MTPEIFLDTLIAKKLSSRKSLSNGTPKLGTQLIGYSFSLLAAVSSLLVSLTTPISGYDAAYNMQVAYSIANDFVYSPSYHKIVYAPEITTNGVLQYLLAVSMIVFGERLGLSLVLAFAIFLLFAGTFALSRRSFFVLTVLFFSWSPFFGLSIQFLGEIFSAACVVLGIFILGNAGASPKRRNISELMPFLASGIFFSLAAQTKLVTTLIILPLVIGVVFSRNQLRSIEYKNTLINLLAVGSSFTLSFVMGYFFSVWHSWEKIGTLSRDFKPSSLTEFIVSHFRQSTSRVSVAPWEYITDSNFILPLMVASGAVVLLKSLWWTPLVSVVAAYLFTGGANDRRVFVFVVILLIVAAWESSRKSEISTTSDNQDPHNLKPKIFSSLVGILTTFYVAFFLITISTEEIVFHRAVSSFSSLAQEIDSGHFSPNHLIPESDLNFIKRLRAIEEPILTSGWWQFPEYQIWGPFDFYDRMDLELPGRLGAPPSMYLLFDESISAWPDTSLELCSRVVYRKGPIVLCLFRDDLPLNTLG